MTTGRGTLAYLPSREQRAWAAGFFDGEGCSTLGKIYKETTKGKKMYRMPRLVLGQTDKGEEILTRFKEAIGNFGTVLSTQHKYKGEVRPTWAWACGDLGKIQTIMGAMWPYLSAPKKDQFKNVMKEYLAFRALGPVFV